MKKFSKILLVLLFLFALMFLSAYINRVSAEEMKSDSYKIQFGNFNMGSGQRDGDTYVISDTMGGLAVGPYGHYGSDEYFIGSGFQYVYQIDYFFFSLSKLNIELGELFAGSFKTDSHTINVTTNGASGYNIYVFENHPLRQITADGPSETTDINDTNCDVACDEDTAGLWTNASNPGFGFNVSGDDVAADFINSNYFRQFANNEASENMQSIMGSDNVALDSSATVTYKAAMPGDQAAGNYQTSIVFVAVPGY
jgi:hypothetical protein